MGRTAHITARIEPKLKEKAEEILSAVGLSTSAAISLFYRQVVYRKGLPFDVCVPNDVTIEALKELEAGGGTVHHGSAKELFDEIVAGD